MNVAAMPLDAAVAERLITAVTPLTIELALEALTSLEERDKAIAAQWRGRIERARYDAAGGTALRGGRPWQPLDRRHT